MRRFGGGNRAERKQTIIDKVLKFFEKYFGIGIFGNSDSNMTYSTEENDDEHLDMVAEDGEKYEIKDD